MNLYQREYRKGFNRGYEDHALYVKPRCGAYRNDAFKEGYEDGWKDADEKAKERDDYVRAPGDPF